MAEPATGRSIQGPLSIDQALRLSRGSRVVMETEVSDLKIEGTLYTVCPQTSLVVVLTGSPPSTFHVLSIASLSSFTLLSLPKTPQPGQSSLTPINIRTLSDRANNILLREKEKAAKLNQGVDKTTQDLFDGLDKQFSARWKGRDIIVMERVVVKGPGYRNEDCKVITKDGEGLLSRVKKVLENERRRALQRESGRAVKPAIPNISPAVPAPQGQKKGG